MGVPGRIAFSTPLALVLLLAPGTAFTAESLRGATIRVTRAAGTIAVDGDLSDPGWKGAARVDTWHETNPGDNVPPKVRSVGYLTYDDRYFYAGFEFLDPDPSSIRAPYADRDDISESIDYGGIALDTRNDGRTAILFLATPRGVQYDAIQDDALGSEDSSPDFYWSSAGRITSEGWTLEIRIPFSSLRYDGGSSQTWGILLFRSYPRENRYELFSTTLPRGSNCFICHENVLEGLEGLPSGDHFVVAPYASAKKEAVPRGGAAGSLESLPWDATGGLDAKWIPDPDHALDLALNPDFSQVESDVARISANERFAIFYPEKRPFFLEGMELFSTSIQAVYTRTITSPRWGIRATGKHGDTAYTALAAEDRGGGLVILPGPESSSFAPQDFSSRVAVARVRHDIGGSFVSFLATDREIDGGGHNRVIGPDFQWRPSDADVVTGQVLFSKSQTPNRPELAPEWDGRRFSGVGMDVWWSHTTRHIDVGTQLKWFGDGFRADCGFVPQAGYREGYTEGGYTWHPTGFLSRVRALSFANYVTDSGGEFLRGLLAVGTEMNGRWNSFGRFWLWRDEWRVDGERIPRRQLLFTVQASPSMLLSFVSLDGRVGEEIDFENARPGHGANLTFGTMLRTGDHLTFRIDASRRWLDVRPDGGGAEARLFTADVARLKATFTFSSRCFVRLIGQRERTQRNPALYRFPVMADEGSYAGSALFSYKLNWQSVLFLGYGDDRTLDDQGRFVKTGKEIFLKVSYAFQG